MRRVLLGVILAAAMGSAAVVIAQTCTTPPLRQDKGPYPLGALNFSFVGTWDSSMRTCVEAAISAWETALRNQGRASFTLQPTPGGQSPNMTLVMTNLGATAAAGITDRHYDAEGYTNGAGVQFTTNTSLLSTCDGFKKAALHELGHFMGLADAAGCCGSSVMNQMSGGNDSGGHIPLSVTSCDQGATDTTMPADPCNWGGCPPGYTSECVGDQQPDPSHCWCCVNYSPIIIDLNRDGFQFSDAVDGVSFIINDVGTVLRIGWPIDTHDGWLALDRNGNGRIDSGAELFGNTTRLGSGAIAAHGYEALAELDENSDEVIDARDRTFRDLRVWTDLNRNGHADAAEVRSLRNAGVASISLRYRESRRTDQWGNRFAYLSTATSTNGGRLTVADVYPVTGISSCALKSK